MDLPGSPVVGAIGGDGLSELKYTRDSAGIAERVEQFDELLRSGDVDAMLGGFVELVRDVCTARGAALLIERDPGTPAGVLRHARLLGVSEELALELGVAVQAGGLPAAPRHHVECIATHPRFGGTFLASTLEDLGVVAIDTIEFGCEKCLWNGVVTLLLPRRQLLSEFSARVVRLVANRMITVLEHLRVLRDAEQGEARLRAVLDGAYDSVVSIDREGRILSMNRATERMFGYGPSELIGKNVTMLMHEPDRDAARWGLARVAAGGPGRMTSATHEVEGRRKDGSSLTLDLAVNAIEGGLGFTGIMRDVTARKAAEARMRETDRLAVIGALAAGLGHDMNNVLFPIRAHLNALAAGAERMQPERREEHIAQIRGSVAYLQHLADSLHSLALDPDGEGEGIQNTELREWWAQCGPLLMKALHRKADLEAIIPSGLPPVAVPPHALTRAMLNLLVNAGEAMPKDRARELCKVVIRAGIDAAGECVTLEVMDNGTGMDESTRRRAFDMFFTTKIRGLGTGLGLPLVRRVAERAGGSVEIQSRPGLGATIRMRFPVMKEPPASPSIVAGLQVEDGRLAAVVRGYLESRGVYMDGDATLDDVDLLVVDADRLVSCGARHWAKIHPPERLVVLGRPTAAEMRRFAELGVTVIEDVHDISALEQGLETAIAFQQKEIQHG